MIRYNTLMRKQADVDWGKAGLYGLGGGLAGFLFNRYLLGNASNSSNIIATLLGATLLGGGSAAYDYFTDPVVAQQADSSDKRKENRKKNELVADAVRKAVKSDDNSLVGAGVNTLRNTSAVAAQFTDAAKEAAKTAINSPRRFLRGEIPYQVNEAKLKGRTFAERKENADKDFRDRAIKGGTEVAAGAAVTGMSNAVLNNLNKNGVTLAAYNGPNIHPDPKSGKSSLLNPLPHKARKLDALFNGGKNISEKAILATVSDSLTGRNRVGEIALDRLQKNQIIALINKHLKGMNTPADEITSWGQARALLTTKDNPIYNWLHDVPMSNARNSWSAESALWRISPHPRTRPGANGFRGQPRTGARGWLNRRVGFAAMPTVRANAVSAGRKLGRAMPLVGGVLSLLGLADLNKNYSDYRERYRQLEREADSQGL